MRHHTEKPAAIVSYSVNVETLAATDVAGDVEHLDGASGPSSGA
jgi:hypothetical protein